MKWLGVELTLKDTFYLKGYLFPSSYLLHISSHNEMQEGVSYGQALMGHSSQINLTTACLVSFLVRDLNSSQLILSPF